LGRFALSELFTQHFSKQNMGLPRRHKLIYINNLRICSGNFGTNGTVFHSF